MSFETIKDIVNFNPSRPLSKGKEFPFIDMASLPVNGRDITEISNKVFNGGGAKFKNGDTLFARITPCLENGKTAKVENLPVGCIAHGSTEFIVLSAKSKDDEDFVYYLARLPDFRSYAISRMEGTSGRQRVSWQALAEFNLRLPEKGKRKKIGEILKSIDDKIHLNNQINQTLESIAQVIFKSWFIDFDPVRAKIAAKQEGNDPELAAMCAISGKSEAELEQIAKEDFAELQATAALFPDELVESELGEVPKGWVVSIVGEQVQTVGGGTPSTKNADFWDNGIHHWTTPKDLSNLTDKILLNTERKITDAGLKKISSGLLPKNTVLMSSRAPVGYLALAKIEVAINQGYIAILPNTKYSAEYLIHWCKANMAEIKGRASGTTFQEISKKNFREINFIRPDEKVIAVYTRTAKTLYDEITLKAKEKQSLINLRDTLLPKLLLGEVEIPDFINEGE
ncbi:restriction endonuclease subunit S [Acinetobacter baumannii]|uniref:restriction endonuclease subunit S n=2 Tax=Acinetobacter baumannii TaxID=470 RepID=UPI001D0CEA10|nr:restriction endonuclease subunit S [Acinetobacter baumannii]MCT6581470.1 restriction endonuclease subunit S [Acinetobacter baumannii]MCT6586357.1 restriction endonuclease subunit S [Acinetobacter baumannii]MCT6594864.1 restriction endonuclease subunit S [Acinetobacter baumannii]MCT6654734.1 restriction endonuclease subunit S [Acinetobacter baumannii]MCT6658509.1 restriction endonuclease subunit S [Acinetobacter baumannii]